MKTSVQILTALLLFIIDPVLYAQQAQPATYPVLHGQITYFQEKDGQYRTLPIQKNDIVLVGDDLIDRGEWTAFYGDRRVKNRGIALEGTECTLYRIESIALAQPAKLFLYTGLYDIKRGRSGDSTAMAILRVMAQINQYAPQCKVYVLGLVPDAGIKNRSDALEHLNKVNEILLSKSRLPAEQRTVENMFTPAIYTYIDLPAALVDENTGYLAGQYTFNGISLNGKGYYKFSTLLAPYIGIQALNKPKDKEYPGKSGYYLHRVSILNSLPLHPGCVIMVGNSLTNIGRWEEFFPQQDILNYGISGDGVDGLQLRLGDIIAHKPSRIFLMIGINDFINNKDASAKEVAEKYFKIISRLRQELPQTKLHIQSTLPLSPLTKYYDGRNEKVNALNQRLQSAAVQMDYTYLDIASGFSDANGNLAQEYTCDGIHLLGKAYIQWKNYLSSFILDAQ